MSSAQEIHYAESHEWIRLDDDTATIGISEFAVNQLSDLVNLELPEVGASYEAGDSFGEVESVKTVSDLYLPVSGTVTAVNSDVISNLELLASSPLEDGWLIQIEVKDPSELESLLSPEAYLAMVEEDDDMDDGDLDLDDLLDGVEEE